MKTYFKVEVASFDGYQDVLDYEIKIQKGYSVAVMAKKAVEIARRESKVAHRSGTIVRYPGGRIEDVYIDGKKQ